MADDGREVWAGEPVFICKPDGSEFTEHRAVVGTPDMTVCGITYYSLPFVDPEDPESGRNWFAEHERDPHDVLLCKEGCLPIG